MSHSTILFTLMNLDIGGAETHVVTLCKQLKDLGYNIIVASNGGIYQKELSQYGIKHYKVSLNTKNPLTGLHSFGRLINIVRKENVEIIHAHARIPAFISNIVSRLLGVKFITTAHAKFRCNFLLKNTSKWGEKTIAVSQDIKDHLINIFGVDEKNIEVIANGIDTNLFKTENNYEELLREFKINDSNKKIVWVSRIDDFLYNPICELIKAIDVIIKEFPNVTLFIVGSGEKFDAVKSLALQKNNEIGTNAIHVTGPRTDVNKFLNMADVFVGISRAALEAMACSKPVILAGPWSYIGIIDEKIIDIAIKDNFTGRTTKNPVTHKLLEESLLKILNMTNEEKASLGDFGRTIVIKDYSSDNMGKITARVYQDIIKNRRIEK